MSLDPKSNRRERETDKAQKSAEAPPLNPPFPHRRQAFDPLFFSLERETPEEAASFDNARPA